MNAEIDKPVRIFLDVDGVLNLFPYNRHNGKWDDYTTEFVETFGRRFPMTISRKCCDSLATLNAEIWWLTTWGDEANVKLSGLTGFDELPVLAEMPFRNTWSWKGEAVEKWFKSEEGSDRFIWIDDDAIPVNAERTYPEALLIRTVETEGITPEHIRQMQEYLASS